MRITILIALILLLHSGKIASAQKVEIDIRPDAIHVTEGKDSVLTFQTGEKSLNGAYTRANYIHPLYTLDGQVLTEDFPPDHLHQRGIFWAWHQLYIGDKRIGDGWEIVDFSWEVISAKVVGDTADARTIRTEVLWKSPQWTVQNGNEKAVVRETTHITVYPEEESYRKIDFKISLLALEKGMRIGGSEDDKGYGGFSARIRLDDRMVFTGPDGKVNPQNLPVEARGWIDISGPVGKGGAMAGLSILSHPDNPGYPNPWILRSSGSMQNAVYPHPGAIPVPLSDMKPTTLRYRLIIHHGDQHTLDISEIHADFSKTR